MTDEKNEKSVDENSCASCSHVHKEADGSCKCGCKVGVEAKTEAAV